MIYGHTNEWLILDPGKQHHMEGVSIGFNGFLCSTVDNFLQNHIISISATEWKIGCSTS